MYLRSGKALIIHLFFLVGILGILASLVGYLIGLCIDSKSINVVSGLYQVAAGMMTGIVCFEMLPECIKISDIYLTIVSCVVGILLTLLLDIYINKISQTKSSSLLIIISMTVHNIVEGIAIGSSFIYSNVLGYSILISNVLHDFPESIVVGIGLNKDKKSLLKKITFVGLSTAMGSVLGNIIGSIDNTFISISLAMSSGCMLYIVSCDLIPNSKNISKNKFIYLIYVLGILIGAYITNYK